MILSSFRSDIGGGSPEAEPGDRDRPRRAQQGAEPGEEHGQARRVLAICPLQPGVLPLRGPGLRQACPLGVRPQRGSGTTRAERSRRAVHVDVQ